MTSATSGGFWVRPPEGADHDAWAGLYASYAEFYGVEQTAAHRQVVWDWIMDPAHDVEALLLVDASGQPVGLAHFRPFARPLAASTGCFLDDLFVHPSSRGGGGAPVLLSELRRIARERGWSVVRWITADDNYRARAVYDRSATRTHWITYDMAPD